ncbi:MAG: hypothetical protein EBQ99_07400 [Planctomycetes bacterium]|nr:hypothetical protein [Planctomycetota bacterium]
MPKSARLLASLVLFVVTAASQSQSTCCTPGSQAGCADEACTESICGIDPWCCSVEWDQRCATEASVLCTVCSPQTACNPPTATLLEAEACGALGGDPCGTPAGLPTSLPWMTSVQGTLWASDLQRDVDWYAFELTEPSRVQVHCWSQGPLGTALIDDQCPPTVHADGPDGCPATIEACLPAGSYRVVVRSLLFETLPCGDPRGTYVLRIAREPCQPDPPVNDRRADALSVGEGLWNFDSAEASTDPEPLPAWCDEGTGLAISNDVWFLFDPPRAAWWTIGTCGASPWDTRIAIYPPGSSMPMACSDDACQGDAAELRVPLEAGEPVLIRLGGWGHGGLGVLRILEDGGNGSCPGDLDGDAHVTAADIGSLLVVFGSDMAEADLDGSGTVDSGDLGLLLILIGPCPENLRGTILSEKIGELDSLP